MVDGCTRVRSDILDHGVLKHLLSLEPKAFVMAHGDKEMGAALRDLLPISEELSYLEKLLTKLQQMHQLVRS